MSFRRVVLLLALTITQLTGGGLACIHGDVAAGLNLPPEKIPSRNVTAPGRVRTAIENVRIFDGYRIQEPSTLFIDDGIIVPHLSDADVVVDGLGGVLLPGLIDSHCHVANISNLEELSSYGITTALNMACVSYPLCAALRNQVGLTSFITAGFPAQGFNTSHAINMNTPPNMLINSSSQAEQFVQNVIGNGSDWLKITAELNGPDQATQNALVAAAHARGLPTMTHAADLPYYEQAILSKTDGIQHAPADQQLSPEFVDLMVRQRQHATPTMELARLVFAEEAVEPDILTHLGVGPMASYTVWRANVVAMHRAGVPILAGTDASIATSFNRSAFGWTLHAELANLVDADHDPAEALRAATMVPARVHNLTDRGRIAPGMRADLLLLTPDAEPLRNITDTTKISRVWIAGIEYPNVTKSA